jgi:hypothetical protein
MVVLVVRGVVPVRAALRKDPGAIQRRARNGARRSDLREDPRPALFASGRGDRHVLAHEVPRQ